VALGAAPQTAAIAAVCPYPSLAALRAAPVMRGTASLARGAKLAERVGFEPNSPGRQKSFAERALSCLDVS
jgi:hypothetical protein